MRAISLPLRERMVQLYEAGRSTRDLARMLAAAWRRCGGVRQQFKERGTLRPRTPLAGRKTLLDAGRQARLVW